MADSFQSNGAIDHSHYFAGPGFCARGQHAVCEFVPTSGFAESRGAIPSRPQVKQDADPTKLRLKADDSASLVQEGIVIADAGHFSFLTPCPDALRARAPQICTDQPGFDRIAFQQEFTAKVIRFFRDQLRQ